MDVMLIPGPWKPYEGCCWSLAEVLRVFLLLVLYYLSLVDLLMFFLRSQGNKCSV